MLFLVYYFKKYSKPCFNILKTFCSSFNLWIGEFVVSFFDVTKGYKLCDKEKQILFLRIFTNFWTNQIVWKTNKWVNQRITQAGKFVKLCNDKIWFLLTHPLNSSHVCKSLPWVLGFLNIRGLNKYVAQRLCKFSHAKFTKLLRCSKDDKTENMMRRSGISRLELST